MFISFEGIDGSGKGTQIQLFTQYLERKGIECVTVHEPGSTNVGEMIRQLLLNKNLKIDPKAELFLFLASRAQLVNEVIVPALRKGKVVVSDRFIDSSVAYQGAGRDIGIEAVENLNRFATSGIKPDITFYLDIKPETAFIRKKLADRMEMNGINFLKRVRESYLTLASKEPNRIIIVNAEMDIQTIHAEIVKFFEEFVKQKNYWNILEKIQSK